MSGSADEIVGVANRSPGSSYRAHGDQTTPFGISILVGLGILSLIGALSAMFQLYGGPGLGFILVPIAITFIIFKL